jgi:ribosome maturation factor RimP
MAQRDRGAPARTARRSFRPVSEEPRVDLRALRVRFYELVEPVVSAAELDLDGLTVSPAGRRLVVRVTVDGDAGVGHDQLSDVSRDISTALDRAEQRGSELTPGSYVLEVSSPGVDRPLTLPRHWRRNVGRLVTVRAGGRRITDRVSAADAAGVTFEATGFVHFDAVGAGRVQVEFAYRTATEGADTSEEDEA